MMYRDVIEVMSGKHEFGRWMFLESSNKTWTWVISVSAIGGATAYLLKKAFGRK